MCQSVSMLRVAMDRPTISIIVPVFQNARYLPQCLDSVYGQSFTDWEVILVDDGSTDGGEKLCDEYASSSARVSVYHQKHAGLSAARNTGLDHRSGEYIAMLDADDILLDPDYLLLLYEAAIDNNAEISMCGHVHFFDGAPLPEVSGTRAVQAVIRGQDAFNRNVFSRSFHLDVSHGKLFHHRRFRGIRYPVGRNMEDSFVMHHLVFPCERVAVVDLIMYAHRVHAASIMNSVSNRSLSQDLVYGLQDRIRYFESIGRHDLAQIAEQKLLQGIMNQHILNEIRNRKGAEE